MYVRTSVCRYDVRKVRTRNPASDIPYSRAVIRTPYYSLIRTVRIVIGIGTLQYELQSNFRQRMEVEYVHTYVRYVYIESTVRKYLRTPFHQSDALVKIAARVRGPSRVATPSPSPKMNHESTSVDEIRDRLRQHFADTPEVERNQKWSQLWENGFVPWDRGRPNPALEDALADQAKPLEAPSSDEAGSRRKRALVPGCGKGYDVLLLASFGYDAYGLEVSPMAVEQCREFAREHAGEYPPRNLERGSGRAVFILGDFFEDGWLGEADGASAFDLIYDYTVSTTMPSGERDGGETERDEERAH